RRRERKCVTGADGDSYRANAIAPLPKLAAIWVARSATAPLIVAATASASRPEPGLTIIASRGILTKEPDRSSICHRAFRVTCPAASASNLRTSTAIVRLAGDVGLLSIRIMPKGNRP